jgi:hypothetical protein
MTMLWSTLSLDTVGKAEEIDHWRHVYLAYPAEDNTYAARYEYKTSGDSITIGSFTPCRDICASNRIGLLSDSTIALTVSYNPYPTNPIVWLYRLVQSY